MTDTPKIKEAAAQKLRHFYGSQWANRLAVRSGYTADYVRKYFRTDSISQPILAETAIELINEAKQEEKSQLEKLK